MDRSNLNPVEILEAWITGDRPLRKIGARELELLAVWELADEARARAFNITPDSAADVVRHKTDLLFALLDKLHTFPQKSTIFLETLWNLWLPLAIQLSTEKQSFNRPLIQGILGSQGTGKTTLCQVLKVILEKMGYSTVSISLDDLYKTYADRQQLQKTDPRLIWRGPPGTHDIDLGIAVLDKLRGSETSELAAVDNLKSDFPPTDIIKNIEIPRFDKSGWGGAGDRTQPEIICGADIVLFEGWFVGVNPVADATLNEFLATEPFPISTEADCLFARDMNAKLHDYLPLWNRLDRLMVLYPRDYRVSQVWRNQAEREMMAAGKSGMSEAEINRFVEYFWKALHPELFMQSMLEGDRVDLVIEILDDRTASKICRAIDLKSIN
ncbi:glycerate kinase [Tychonema sp. LEGE 07199]|uniref:glycerate kinase n=1 Tax=unclassified Tychonema TaxID=2642144 RepID=UPI001882B101|nr:MULTISPECIES: glycerate kinase [unclassified Tychonema]MBE9121073.1 glycerate kinase [Tychonema sp. LEGE 07199]MBE9133496.1 glycerate kinase [Tychonema sp. LEGE 07196]